MDSLLNASSHTGEGTVLMGIELGDNLLEMTNGSVSSGLSKCNATVLVQIKVRGIEIRNGGRGVEIVFMHGPFVENVCDVLLEGLGTCSGDEVVELFGDINSEISEVADKLMYGVE